MTIHTDVDRIFKDGLADYSQKPPQFVWDNIEQGMNKKRIRQRRTIYYSIAASVALLISFGSGYLLTAFHNEQGMIVQNHTHVITPDEPEQKPANNATVQSTNDNIVTDKSLDTAQDEAINEVSPQTVNSTEAKRPEVSKSKNGDKKKSVKSGTVVKKASAEGTLLPPMFSSGATYDPTQPYQPNAEETQKVSNNIDLAYMQNKSGIIDQDLNQQKDINYAIRQLPVYIEEAYVAEDTDSKEWSVGLSATPLVSYRMVGSVNSDYVYSADITTNYEQDYSNERPLMSYSTGVNVGYKVSKRWHIQSGIYFSEIGFVSENVNVFDYQSLDSPNETTYNLNTSAGNVRIVGTTTDLVEIINQTDAVNQPLYIGGEVSVIQSSVVADFIQTFSYYEIPMVVNYKLIDRKLSMNLSGGMSANILSGNKTYVKNDAERKELDGEAQDLKNASYNGIVGFGFEYPLVAKLNFNLQPTFRYSLSPLSETGNVHPYSFGVYTGIKYVF